MLTRSYCLRAFPALQQLILNRINDIVTLGVGLAESGVAIGQALGTILPTLGTAIGQVLDGEFVPAFNTVTDALRDAAVGIVTPTLAAIIDRRTRALEVSAALQTAVPLAIVQFGNGVLSAINGVIVALLAGGEGVLDALLPPDLGAVIDAVVDGAQGLGLSLVNGAPNAPAIVCCAAAVPSTPLAFQRQEGFSSSIAQVPGLDDGNLITLGTGSLDPVSEPEDQPKGPDITDRKVTPLMGNLSAALSRIQDRFTRASRHAYG